jgi:small-conductance mechanosensitive channel
LLMMSDHWSILASLPVFMMAGALLFQNIGLQIVPFSLGPRFAGFDSLRSLLRIDSVLGVLGFAIVTLILALMVDIFSRSHAQFFYFLGLLAIYAAIFVIGLANKDAADTLVRRIRAARELKPEACLEADVEAFARRGRDGSPPSIITGYEILLRPADKRRSEPEVRASRRVIWWALGFLVAFPLYGVTYVYHNYESLTRLFPDRAPKSIGASARFVADVFLFATKPCSEIAGGDGTQSASGTGSEDDKARTRAKACAEAEKYAQNLRSNMFVVVLLFLYFSFLIFFPLRYVTSLFEYRSLLKWSKDKGLGLETDVVQKSGLVVSLFFSVVIALMMVHVPFGQIGVFSGLVAAGLSIALRDTLGNLLAGALLIWDGTLKKGDVITIPRSVSSDTGSTYGIVHEMRMRYTVVEDRNTVRRLIPNSVLVANPVESWTHADQKVRLSLRLGVAYGTDLREAKQVMESVCYDVPRILPERPPQALVVNFGESAIEFSLRFWLRDTSEGIRPVISDLLISLFERFEEVGIEVPYPQRDLHIKSVHESVERIATKAVAHQPDWRMFSRRFAMRRPRRD